MKKFLKLIRVKHYIKNVLVLSPLIFSKGLTEINNILIGFFALLGFSLLASSIYIFNDIQDIENDKKNPIKKNRPLANGDVSINYAKIVMILLLFISIIITIFISKNIILSLIIIFIYFILNILYSLRFKKKPIIDVSILSFGFILRVLYGGSIFNIPLSNWLILSILSISFYMSFGKRRGEIIKNGNKSREVLKYYTVDFLEKNMYMFLSLSLVFYSLWATTVNSIIMITIPFIFMLCLNYNLIVEDDNEYFGDPVDVLMSTKTILLLVAIVVAIIIWGLYFPDLLLWFS